MADQFWENFYSEHKAPKSETSFARFVQSRLPNQNTPLQILDFGCGNGRDSFFFIKNGHEVTGLDLCPTAIAWCSNSQPEGTNSKFVQGDLRDCAKNISHKLNLFYSRFSIHAVNLETENEIYKIAAELLETNGTIAIEVRTIYDELMNQGKAIGENEFLTDHYRRFIIPTDMFQRLSKYFRVQYFDLSRGFAQYGKEDPIVLRILATKAM